MSDWISLNGPWRADIPGCPPGVTLPVPGCWDAVAGRKDVEGPVRIYREFEAPEDFRRLNLAFGGVSYACDIAVNGMPVGGHEGVWDGFSVDITDAARHGVNLLELTVWKPGYRETDRYPLRQVLSGFLPDVCCTFGGIWDDVYLITHDDLSIAAVSADGQAGGTAAVRVRVRNAAAYAAGAQLTATVLDGDRPVAACCSLVAAGPCGESEIVMQIAVDSPALWSPADPRLYRCAVTLEGEGSRDSRCVSIGFRSVGAEGQAVTLNGSAVYLRGVLHWGYYDDLLIPKPAAPAVEAEIGRVRELGFNMIKHCLYIPRDEYLDAADRMGMLLWVELPLWLPEGSPELAARIEREYPEILRRLAGHPSVVLISLGCELDDTVGGPMLERMYGLAKSLCTALVRDNSGSGECYGGLARDWADFYDYHFYADGHHLEQLIETFTPQWRAARPWLFGEFCDSDTFRNLRDFTRDGAAPWWTSADPKENPVAGLKPDFRLDRQAERFERCGLGREAETLQRLSVSHAMAHRKLTIELTRAFPEVGGYNVTSIRDVPIATSGLFDDRLDPKFDAAEFRRFNGDVVLLPAWDLGRTWVCGDRVRNRDRYNYFSGSDYSLHILVSNYGGQDIANPEVRWSLRRGGEAVASGHAAVEAAFPHGGVAELVRISARLPEAAAPESLVLDVEMEWGGRLACNRWPVFLYPEAVIPKGIPYYDPLNLLAQTLEAHGGRELGCGDAPAGFGPAACTAVTPALLSWVREGGRLLLLQRGRGYLPVRQVAFWREGLPRRYDHPVFDGMAEGWMEDLRYFSVATDTAFESCAPGGALGAPRPVLRRFDMREFDATNYIAEYKHGRGAVLATTLRLEGGAGRQPEPLGRNPFGLFLLERMLGYLRNMQ